LKQVRTGNWPRPGRPRVAAGLCRPTNCNDSNCPVPNNVYGQWQATAHARCATVGVATSHETARRFSLHRVLMANCDGHLPLKSNHLPQLHQAVLEYAELRTGGRRAAKVVVVRTVCSIRHPYGACERKAAADPENADSSQQTLAPRSMRTVHRWKPRSRHHRDQRAAWSRQITRRQEVRRSNFV
jgi:hypothetical protein